MESLEIKIAEQTLEISELKHQLFMLKLEMDRISLQVNLTKIDVGSLERRHENLLDFTCKQINK